jgi:hypothetical protein
MHLIHLRRHRVAALAVAATTVALIAVVFAILHPWNANAAESAKSTLPAADHGRGADVGTDAAVNPWEVNGISPAALNAAEWDCLYVVHAVHCTAPGMLASVTSGTAETFTVLVFDTMDPASDDAPFLGAESNIRADLFDGEPCPTDPPSRQYTYLGPGGLDIGLDYYACHGFDSPL